jgi:glucosamine--fructose-6-phosphate aminotransferase (isomerizing)
MNQLEPDRLYIARKGSPLVVGLGEQESFVASDVAAILRYTRQVIYLEDRDAGVLTSSSLNLWDDQGRKAERAVRQITWDQATAEKSGYKHFMLKEIFEQPHVIADTLSDRISENQQKIILNGAEHLLKKEGRFPFENMTIIACGTSYHAGLVGKYWIEEMARIPVSVDLASEFRYRNPIVGEKTLMIAISQSGETADTLAALNEAKAQGAKVLAISNVTDSSIARASDEVFYTRAGPEIGVASTKAFTTQLVALLLIALHLGVTQKKLSPGFLREALASLAKVPEEMESFLKTQKISKIADKYLNSSDFLFFARGLEYPIALEGALKLKEISYIHAEGYAAGEMKHGPIALIDSKMPVVVLAPRDKTYEKVLSNMEEVRARGARVIAVGIEGDQDLERRCEDLITVPKTPWYINPLLMVLPLQLLAYYVADSKGMDVDQPRNLAKSVTVE